MSTPYNLFLVPTDELWHQKGAEAVSTSLAAVGFTKKKKIPGDGLCHLVLFLYSVSQERESHTAVLMPWSLQAEHCDQNSTLYLYTCMHLSKPIISYIFPPKAFINPCFQRTRSFAKVPLSIKSSIIFSALCDSSCVCQHTGMVTFQTLFSSRTF